MVTVRSATSGDLPELLELMRTFPAPTIPADAYVSECLALKLADANSYLAVAEQDRELVAYISGYRHLAFYAGGQTAWCDELLVRADKRGMGTGRLMMERFEEWAQLNGCVLVSLATAGARDFYEALGYSSRAGYYKKYLL